mmetsp:Transcript_29405/g.68069  ORF Transcript_29405/g.68069 Transcript_29405/m.68069 type:complete len:242 (-) Transcript_29405:65-790(-)|eukprot:CAMPEP_0116848844 /NCGR_PEP_ID=MMETSP0418-20121206/15239_1 /TAXON_ID=1158023 /ORGANISM="Astrosyne radiata, Strain 13vi08-1A" /LENGTH=241 /DNA_ID=CAMNT_0004480493 /DNA_START=146 /DNA_END=871 /DNA_ORIENTATION=-
MASSSKKLHEQLYRLQSEKTWVSSCAVPVINGPSSFVLGDCVMHLTFFDKYEVMEFSTSVLEMHRQGADETTEEYCFLMALTQAKVTELDKAIQECSNRELVLVIRDHRHVLLLRQTPMSLLNEENLVRFRRLIQGFCKVARRAKAEMAEVYAPSVRRSSSLLFKSRSNKEIKGSMKNLLARQKSESDTSRERTRGTSKKNLFPKQKSESSAVVKRQGNRSESGILLFNSLRRRKKTAQAA